MMRVLNSEDFILHVRIDMTKWSTHNSRWPNAIVGNSIPSQKTFELDDTFTNLEIGDKLTGNIHIEQIPEDRQPSIEIKGDANLVEQVKYNLYNGRLILSADNRFRSRNNLTINLYTNDLKSIQADFVGSIRMDRAFTGEAMEIIMKGVGSFRADSLYINVLTVRTEGVGSSTLSGKADRTSLATAGTGSINAFELLSDTVSAYVNGVGSIRCNPIAFLEGRIYGIGSITYKEEPLNKDISSFGIGSIKKR